MPATPADIARYTQDGVAITYKDTVLKAAQPNAIDAGEIPTLFRYEADGLAMLNERASLQSGVGKFHEAVEVDEVLGIGSIVSVTPITPSFRAIDETRDIDVIARTRSTSFDGTIDRYSVELVG
jgi:hypothetical protein